MVDVVPIVLLVRMVRVGTREDKSSTSTDSCICAKEGVQLDGKSGSSAGCAAYGGING